MFFITTLDFRYSATGSLLSLTGNRRQNVFGRRIAQLECLFNLEVGQTFDFEDAAENTFFFSRPWPQSADRRGWRTGNGMHQVTQGDAGLHFAQKRTSTDSGMSRASRRWLHRKRPDRNRLGS